MKFYCCECGRPVPVSEDGKIVGHCARHINAKRTKKNWAGEWFAEMRRVVDAAQGIGKVFHDDGRNYWRVLENRVRNSQGGAL